MAKNDGDIQLGRCHAVTRNGAPQLRATRRDGLTRARREARARRRGAGWTTACHTTPILDDFSETCDVSFG